jgi:Ribbon-helix-helix protein, copG family
MAQKPLATGYTGEAPMIGSRVEPGDLEQVDRIRQARGQTRAEFLRAAVKAAIATGNAEVAKAS